MGAAQLFFSGVRHSISLYVTGFLLTIGVIFGRFICGYVCPMGLLQDLLYRIKTPKIILRLRFLRYVKYIVLLLFVIILPMVIRHELSGLGHPWFCAYICPSGTLFGAIPLLATNDFLREFVGMQFAIKMVIAGGIIIVSVFILRIFCRVLCPLGAIYAVLNRIAIVHMQCDKNKCTSCNKCSAACHVKIEPMKHPNASECFRCGKCVSSCDQKALAYKIKRQENARHVKTDMD
jgi:polyferredoxin